MLTEEQKYHNLKLDYEIAQAEREFQHLEEMGRIKMRWFKATYPNALGAEMYCLNITSKRMVGGIYYAE